MRAKRFVVVGGGARRVFLSSLAASFASTHHHTPTLTDQRPITLWMALLSTSLVYTVKEYYNRPAYGKDKIGGIAVNGRLSSSKHPMGSEAARRVMRRLHRWFPAPPSTLHTSSAPFRSVFAKVAAPGSRLGDAHL